MLYFPFFGENCSKFRELFKGKANVSFRYGAKIGSSLTLQKAETEWLRRGLVYCIGCKDCNKVYVGETARCLKSRVREHKGDVKVGKEKNAIAKHVGDFEHDVNWDDVVLLEKGVRDWYKRRVLESLWINKLKENTMNGNVGLQGLSGWNKFWNGSL